jgi:hypothetical protein
MTQGFLNSSNALPADNNMSAFGGTQLGTNLNLGVGGGFASTNGAGATGPYSLELVTTFTAGGAGGSFNVDSNIGAPVPEPVSIFLEGTMFVLVGVGLRLRRRKVA